MSPRVLFSALAIRALRRRLRLSQAEFGASIGYTRSMVSAVELGAAPSLHYLETVCAAHRIDIGDLWAPAAEVKLRRS